MSFFGATYSPDDNKIRLYPRSRLDQETFERVKAAGFKWAPRQEIFVAPMWTPSRADLAEELAGPLEDEDTSLTDRAAERAERFEDYSAKRAREAESARQAAENISERFAFGQPILVGHHSERKARKDQERMHNAMSRAVGLWDTAGYWQQRAAGAIAHAKYKELPSVRHRRIKKLESERRGHVRNIEQSRDFLALWSSAEITLERAIAIANRERLGYGLWGELTDGKLEPAAAAERMVKAHGRSIAHNERWIAHIDNRLSYERAMLEEQGGDRGARFPIEPGGRVLVDRGEWLVVLRVNKAHGQINSVTTAAPRSVTWSSSWKYSIERVQDYRPPAAEDAAKIKEATKLPPLCNYPSEDAVEMTAAEWKRKPSDYRFTRPVKATDTHAAHRRRMAYGPGCTLKPVFLTDEKRKDPPALELIAAEPVQFERQIEPAACNMAPARPSSPDPEPAQASFDLMRQALKQGIEIVVADQLFETPPALVERMIDEAGLCSATPAPASFRILEPSAGAGAILRKIREEAPSSSITTIEINAKLAELIGRRGDATRGYCADFLELEPEDLGRFDRILMNPPFKNGADIKHIKHAARFLAPGGRLVAICAGGPRQKRELEPLAADSGGIWEDLPAGTFASSGTGVNTVLLTLEAPAAIAAAA